MILKLEDHIDAEKTYPLKVTFSKGGSGLLFVWHTEMEQHQVFWVRSKEQLIGLWPSLLDKSSDGEPKELWQFNIVAPPPEMRAAFAKHELHRDFRQFVIEVGCQFSALREKVPPPAGYDPCKRYNYRGLSENCSKEDAEAAAKTDKEHAWCRDCFHGFIPRGFTPEQFYLKKRDEVRAFFREQSNRRTRPFSGSSRPRKGEVVPAISTAPAWDPKKPLYAVCTDFGPHSRGATVAEVKNPGEGGWSNITFFFQGKQLKVPREVFAERERRKKRAGDVETKRMKDYKAGRLKEAQDAREMLERLLGPST